MAGSAIAVAMLAGALVGTATPAQAETYLIDDRAAFVAALPHLGLEDFETAAVDGFFGDCGSVVSAAHPTDCFPNGGLEPGVAYITDDYPEPGILVTESHVAGSPTKQLLAGVGPVGLIVAFDAPVDTVGFDLGVKYYGTSCGVSVFYVDGGAPDEFDVDCHSGPSEPRFLGFTSDRLIRAVRVHNPGRENWEHIDNVRFGLRAPNDFSVTAVRKHQASGSATVVVKTPCGGVTAVKGRGVVTALARSSANETVRLKVRPTRATKRRLNRRGRATVTLAITFSPRGGTPATTKRRVTLVKRPAP